MKKSLLTYSFILLGLLGFAQTSETKTEDNLTYEGNEYHLMESYSNAEKNIVRRFLDRQKTPLPNTI